MLTLLAWLLAALVMVSGGRVHTTFVLTPTNRTRMVRNRSTHPLWLSSDARDCHQSSSVLVRYAERDSQSPRITRCVVASNPNNENSQQKPAPEITERVKRFSQRRRPRLALSWSCVPLGHPHCSGFIAFSHSLYSLSLCSAEPPQGSFIP